MQNWPKVSVAIATYNQKTFLAECIESVLVQDYLNLEIIVADDASTDSTSDMLQDYEKKHPDLFKLILGEKNLGITGNVNRAFFACTGRYIAWLAGDDLMLPGKLRKLVEFLEAHPDYAICYHDLDVFDSASGKTIRHFNSGKLSAYPFDGGVEKLVQHGVFLGACSVMTRRSACPANGFDTRIPYVSDWLFWIETAINGKIGFVPEVLGRYRRHPGNVTSKYDLDELALMSLGVVDVRYPFLARYSRLYRAKYLYSRGVKEILSKRTANARPLLLESLRYGWVSWKWIGWFFRSLLGL